MGETERTNWVLSALLLHISVCLWNKAEPNCVLLCYLQKAAHSFRANTWLHYSTLVTESQCRVSYAQHAKLLRFNKKERK